MGEENEKETQSLQEFKEVYQSCLDDFLVFLETEGQRLVPPDPFSITNGADERSFDELSGEELKAVKEILLQELGLSEGTLEERKVRDYVSQPSKDATVPGEIRVSVYETSRDGLYFQELTFPDNQKRWMVGPDQDV